MYPFRAEPPCIGLYREYPPGAGILAIKKEGTVVSGVRSTEDSEKLKMPKCKEKRNELKVKINELNSFRAGIDCIPSLHVSIWKSGTNPNNSVRST